MNKRIIKYILFFTLTYLCVNIQLSGKETNLNSFIEKLDGKEDLIIANALLKEGRLFYFDNNFSDSKLYLNEALKFYVKTGNQKGKIESHSIIGHSYLKQEIYDSALTQYLEVLKLSKQLNDKTEIAKALNSLGRHSSHLKNYEKALKFYSKSLNIIETIDNNTELKAKSLNNIGMTYGYLNEIEKSIEYLTLSLPLREKLGNKENLSILLNNIGYAYLLKNDYNNALNQFNKSLNISHEIKDTTGAAFALLNIAEIHILKKEYKKVIPILMDGLQLIHRLKLENQKDMLYVDSYKFLAEAYEGVDNLNKSLFYYKQFNKIQSKIHEKEYENKIKNTVLLNDIKLKEQQIHELNTENENKTLKIKSNYNFIIFLSSLLIIITSFFVVFYFQKKRLKNKNKILALKNIEIVENERKLQNALKDISSKKKKESLIKNNKPAKYSNSPLSDEQKEEILNKIINQIENKKLFIKEDLTLIMLSNKINVNKSYISQIINEKFEKNFSSYINEYRIKEARAMLSQKENWAVTIETISKSVGFKSISAFNTAFKKYTGITPSYFLNSVKSKS